MVVFPNAKINLGLNVISRRADGYHNLDMVMVPVGWRDVLEIVPAKGKSTTLTVTGNSVDCPMEKNLVYKAWKALDNIIDCNMPAVDIYLHKTIPDGAGLGGGSADAAFTLTALNDIFHLGLSVDYLCKVASTIGADCPFFIHNRTMRCQGIGTDMTPVQIDFGKYRHIVIAKQKGISVSTAEAYGGVTPQMPQSPITQILASPIEEWRDTLINDFEKHIFKLKPQIAALKQSFYDTGAIYASMSGSGAAVYGLFDCEKSASYAASSLTDCDTFVGQL